jgi:Phosphomannomutase
MQKYPHVLKNVRIENKFNLDLNAPLQQTIAEVQDELGSEGRVLIRASGTEPLIRVMVEGKDFALVERCAERLVSVVQAEFS